MVVSTRRAQSSATPPATPSAATRHAHVEVAAAAASGSSKSMSKELKRLAIDAKPKLGGRISSSLAGKTDIRQDAQAREQAPHQLLPDGGVLLTPSPSDAATSPRLRPVTDAPAADVSSARLPSPPAKQALPQTSHPQPQARPSNKRKITQYFEPVPPQSTTNKRHKVDSPVQPAPLRIPQYTLDPTPLPADALDTRAGKAQEKEPQTAKIVQDETVIQPEALPEQVQLPKTHIPDTDEEHDQIYMTAEEEPPVITSEPEPEPPEDAKKRAKRERELARLYTDAKPALKGEASPVIEQAMRNSKRRRQTTQPLAEQERPEKRVRLSLPATARPSSAALDNLSLNGPRPSTNKVVVPNPPVFPAGTDPKMLANGKINGVWLDQWLCYVATITGDDDTVKVLQKEAEYLIKPDRSHETQDDFQRRVSKELDIVAHTFEDIDNHDQDKPSASKPRNNKKRKSNSTASTPATMKKAATMILGKEGVKNFNLDDPPPTAKGKGKAKVI